MKLDMTNGNAGIWFPWPSNKEKTAEGGGVTVRPLTMRQRRIIDAATIKVEKKYIGGVVYTDRTVDEAKRLRLINDYCIVDWTGLHDEHGNAIPCTIDAKERVFLDFPHVAGFLLECMDETDRIIQKQIEDAEKN